MAIRSNDSQRVSGKQYFEHEAQIDMLTNSFGFIGASNGILVPVLGPATAMPADTSTLVKNTYYQEALTNGETFQLPTNVVGGDWVVFRQPSAITAGQFITIGSAANGDFEVGCHITGVNKTATAVTESVDISVATDNSVIIEGLADGAGGAGTYIAFIYNGSKWQVSGRSLNVGDGSALTVGADAVRFAATA